MQVIGCTATNRSFQLRVFSSISGTLLMKKYIATSCKSLTKKCKCSKWKEI